MLIWPCKLDLDHGAPSGLNDLPLALAHVSSHCGYESLCVEICSQKPNAMTAQFPPEPLFATKARSAAMGIEQQQHLNCCFAASANIEDPALLAAAVRNPASPPGARSSLQAMFDTPVMYRYKDCGEQAG